MMAPNRCGGVTRFEFAICMVVASLLAGVLLGRAIEWRRQSERNAAYHVVGALRTALAAREALLGAAAGNRAVLGLMQENPMSWLVREPANYIGEYYAPGPDLLRDGAWFFDRADRTVNYVLGSDTFSSGTSKLLKFKVELSSSFHPARRGRNGKQGVLAIGEVGAGPE